MKKLLLGLFVTAGITAHAQLPAGATAPDFTATDINGVSHTLSEYLAEGKTVILDISATWCGPCWQYHNSKSLEDLYEAYGDGGSGEVVILFVEGDPNTTLANINGQGSNTQGNWAAGTQYPIIDNAAIADDYNTNYFPTVYRICPEGKAYEIDPLSATGLKNNISANCGTLNGLPSHARSIASDVYACEGTAKAKVSVKNYGGSPMTNAILEVKQGNTVVGTKQFTGNLPTFGTAKILFDALDLNPELEYTVAVNSINTVAPAHPDLAQDTFNVSNAAEGPNNFTVKVYTDNYPGEISWKIRNSDNAVIAQGGPYQAGNGTEGAGGPDANTTKTLYVNLGTADPDCLTIEMLDSYGDGWSYGNTPHGMEIVAPGGLVVYSQMVGNFGTSDIINSAFKTNGVLGNETTVLNTFAMYPNPTTGILNFSTQEAVSVSIVDVTGKTVFSAANINNGDNINLSGLQKGMYIAQIKGEKTQKTEKIVIN